jgi:hypothetical protein
MRDLGDLLTSFEQSTYRENVLEQLFCGELLQAAWVLGYPPLEIDRPFVDFQGYDLVASCAAITRHVQLKATRGQVIVHQALAEKPSGCVINLRPSVEGAPPRIGFTFDFFGEAPGEQLDISGLKRAKKSINTRQSDGTFAKGERLHHVAVPRSAFHGHGLSTDDLLLQLFGDLSALGPTTS